jgi:hypothetical protein
MSRVLLSDVSRWIVRRWDFLIMHSLIATMFFLQLRWLHLAAAPGTDEGVHVEAGRMMLEGYVSYQDFSYLHPPALPLFIAIVYGVFRTVYALRFVYLFINTCSLVLFGLIIRHLTKSTLAMVITIAFLVTYNEMLFHDWRLIASRQFANSFFILFLYCGSVAEKKRWSFVAQLMSSIIAALTLFPMVPNIVFASIALIATGTKKTRNIRSRRYAWILCITALAIVSLGVIPHAIDRLLLSHMSEAPIGSLSYRWTQMFHRGSPDSFFYGLACVGLIFGVFFHSETRHLSIAMLGMLCMIFVPREYYPHYVVIAVVALGWGIAELVCLIEKLTKHRPVHAVVLCSLLLVIHAHQSIPRLWKEWMHNRGIGYWQSVDFVRRLPEPILMFNEPMYAIDAQKKIVQHYKRAGRQSFQAYSIAELNLLAQSACSIALTGWDRSAIPAAVQDAWARQFTVIPNTAGFGAYLTKKSGCALLDGPI